jgi:hypothetical protein
MIRLTLQGEKVIGIDFVSPSYQAKDNEVLVDKIPKMELNKDEIGRLYYRNNLIEIEIEKR